MKIIHQRQYLLVVCLWAALWAASCKKSSDDNNPVTPPPPTAGNFTNPLMSGSDPWVIQQDSNYYYTQTSGNKVVLWRTSKMSKLNAASFTTIYSPVANTPNSSNIWAPELHRINGKWYVYFTAGAGPDSTQRIWVLENSDTNPMQGSWASKGQLITTGANFWGIDATTFTLNGNQYLLWSGRPDLTRQNQYLYIGKLSNPWTLEGAAVMISQPQLPWELNGGPVNEAPQALQHNGKTFVMYSASGCWTDDYAMGMQTLTDGADPMLTASWVKAAQPVLVKQPANNVYGPGHNSFFKSRDGNQDWIIYHANSAPGQGCGESRNIRIQPFTWNADGTPNFGTAVKTGMAIAVPTGE